MRLTFLLDGEPAEYQRGWFSGRASLTVGDEVVAIDRVSDPGTHVGIATSRVRRIEIRGHEVSILKVRHRWFGAVRKQRYTVSIDGSTVAEGTGR